MQLEKYVDPLPIPPILKPERKTYDATYYNVRMKMFKQKLHRDLPSTTLWGYEGMYPGPTIVVRRKEKIRVKWENHLPVRQHLLPVDTTVHGAGPREPRVRTVVHLHGANVDSKSDGYPEAWYTNGYIRVGPEFSRETYEYTNDQQAATLWYHDHAIGSTRLNVYAGLAGFYIIHDEYEEALKLPKGEYDIPLVIQDRSFNEDGSLFYPSGPNPLPAGYPNPSIIPGFLGDNILVNGKVWPYLEVEPRKYRFRALNGSNDRFYNLRLEPADKSPAPPWFQIGTDGGLLERPVPLEQLIIAPAERAEFIIDFSDFTGNTILLTNSQPPADAETTGQVMQFRVTLPLSKPDKSEIPVFQRPIYPLEEYMAEKTRDMFIAVNIDQYGRPQFKLNNMTWHDPITEKPILHSVELWRLINSGLGTHPIHIHLIQFQILDRQPFDAARYNATGEIEFTGPAVPPDPNERGWKDTVRANPGFITRIIMRFEGFPGLYVWHCHILEHEDYDMMRPMKVIRHRSAYSGKEAQIPPHTGNTGDGGMAH
jgi:spore coat protein A